MCVCVCACVYVCMCMCVCVCVCVYILIYCVAGSRVASVFFALSLRRGNDNVCLVQPSDIPRHGKRLARGLCQQVSVFVLLY